MTLLQRYKNRFDVIAEFGRLLAIFDSRKAARGYITWRPAKPEDDELFQRHEAWKPRRVRS